MCVRWTSLKIHTVHGFLISFFAWFYNPKKNGSGFSVLARGRELEEQPAQEKRNQSFLASPAVMFRSDSDDSQKFSMKFLVFSLEFFHVVLLRTQHHSPLRQKLKILVYCSDLTYLTRTSRGFENRPKKKSMAFFFHGFLQIDSHGFSSNEPSGTCLVTARTFIILLNIYVEIQITI